jgi:chemotaxis protein histidine kinase CheA/ActR/RegA family two-component response regulator
MMDFNCTNGNDSEASNEFSLNDSRELLAELRRATRGMTQSALYEFASVLRQLLDLHDQNGGDHEIAAFIETSMQEIRVVVGADDSSSELMETLHGQAIDRWGDQLTPLEDVDLEATTSDFDDWGDSDHNDSDLDADADLVAPSAEAISSLLTQLVGEPERGPDVVNTPQPAPATSQPEPSSVSIESLDPELREAFLDDASSCLCSMEDALLRLESDASDADSLNQICRELHTLKGASASVGLTDLADQLHQLEDTLRDDHEASRAPNIDSLLKTVDSVRSQISGGKKEPTTDPASASITQQRQDVCRSAQTPATQLASFADGPDDDESVRVKSSQLNRLMDMLAELVMLRNRRETELTELQENYHELIGSVSKMRLLSNDQWDQEDSCTSLQLSEVANDVLEVAQRVRDCARPVAEGNTAVSQFIRQFRQELVELRRTPVSGLFRRLQRVVRDAAQAESKQVRLRLLGEDAGIERSLQQRLYEPLLHIVRNSVCHGIESADDRAQHGKDPVGTITLEATSGPDLFVIEIRDDGRGLDYDAIRRQGVESGLLAANQAASREELSQLIFQPGFSTRQTASQVAGRGVGMDVVASTLQRMRGWLQVDSEPGQGTRIRLSFPLPSVIQHAMVFRSAGQLFALPMQSVRSAGEVEANSACLSFSQLLGCRQHESQESCQRIELACEAPGAGSSGTGVTLLVDEIVGPEEVVVRPLPSMLKHHPFCSGATLSGMGQTVLFLDARRVVETHSQHLHTSNITLPSPSGVASAQSMRPRVLVVDDSLSARKRVVRSLQRYPLEIVEASDGRQALEITKTQCFAAIFSDMEMPHISGMELLAEINSDVHENPPPVVIISSRSEDEYTGRAKELGATGYLIKPLADEALDGTLREIASLRHLTATSPTTLDPSGELP